MQEVNQQLLDQTREAFFEEYPSSVFLCAICVIPLTFWGKKVAGEPKLESKCVGMKARL